MKVAVVGCRKFTEKEWMFKVLDEIFEEIECSEIISGGAPGVDTIARQYAQERKILYTEFPADWKNTAILRGPSVIHTVKACNVGSLFLPRIARNKDTIAKAENAGKTGILSICEI